MPKHLICTSIPQEFTNTGTFIVHIEGGLQKEDICSDGLGTWNNAQMFVRKYVIGDGNGQPLVTQKNDHNLKVTELQIENVAKQFFRWSVSNSSIPEPIHVATSSEGSIQVLKIKT